MAVAIILALVGLAMAIYVISVHEPTPEKLGEVRGKIMTSTPANGIVTLESHH